MPPDDARVDDTRAWLKRAAEDLRAADHGLAAQPRLLGDAAFHCQQTVEKALKALLAWHDTPFRKTHSLEELGEAVLRLDGTLRSLIDRAAALSEYAWKYRYPVDEAEPTAEETRRALALAREVYAAALSRLPPQAAP